MRPTSTFELEIGRSETCIYIKYLLRSLDNTLFLSLLHVHTTYGTLNSTKFGNLFVNLVDLCLFVGREGHFT